MRTALVTAVTLASLTSVASAGTYIGLGIGSEARGDAEANGQSIGTMDGYERSGRLMLGQRISKLSVEGQLSRFDQGLGVGTYEGTQAAILAKLSLPLGSGFEFFAKGGLQRTWLNHSEPALDAAGSGLIFGGGFEYRLDLTVTSASIFVDYQRASSDFSSDYPMQWEGTSSMWTLGATVSL